jgi:PST family polysaccharide transporter
MLAFGGHLTGFSFLNYFSRNADDILIGRYWGAGPRGFYSKAYQILLLPILQINVPMSSVALPALSRLQDQPERFKSFYFEAIGLMVFVGMPIVAFLFAEAHQVVLLVLGSAWLPSVAIFQALAAAAFVGTFNVAGGWVYVALGRTDRQLKWSLVSVPVTLAGFALGLHWGAVGVGAAFSITQCLLFPFSMIFCYRGTFLRFGELVRKLARPTLISLAAAGVVLLYKQALWPWPQRVWVHLLLGGVIYGLAYLLGWIGTAGGRRELLGILHLLKVFSPAAPSPAPVPPAPGPAASTATP